MIDLSQIRSGLRASLGAMLGFPQLPNARQKAQRLKDARRRSADHTAARALHRRATRAIENGDFNLAESFIANGLRHCPKHSGLLELAAICDIRANMPHRAVNRLAGMWETSSRQRYLLALAQYSAGDIAGAHLNLIELDKHHDCPTPARVLLALMELDRGETDRARTILRRNLEHGADALTCQTLVLTELSEHLPDEAARAAGFLAHAYERDGFNGQWLKSLNLTDDTHLPQAPKELTQQMSQELLQRQHVIPSLIRAQTRKPHPGRIKLLRGALGLIVTRLSDPERGYRCLGELALLASDASDARRWVELGLVTWPASASLALLLDRINTASKPDEAIVRKTIESLRLASQAKPDYADLRRALILLYRNQGADALAMRQAQRWIHDTPDHPLAKRTLKELAA